MNQILHTGDASGAAALRKVLWRLLPFSILLFFVQIIDKTNVSFAALQMNQQLRFTPEVYGFGAGIFFLGAFLFEVPSNLLLLRFGFGDGQFQILQREIELVGIEPLRAPPELHALKLANQVTQPVVLDGKLLALVGKSRPFGALGVAFGPRRDEHCSQHGSIVGERLGDRVHGPIGPWKERVVAPRGRGESISRRSPRQLRSGDPRGIHPPPIEPVE